MHNIYMTIYKNDDILTPTYLVHSTSPLVINHNTSRWRINDQAVSVSCNQQVCFNCFKYE